ncbi:MAG: hypothetical protein RL189_657 [Pseudomonadota bacterium]|jgi:hypothetical protein
MDFATSMFNFSNTLILPFWLMLIFLPRSNITRRFFSNPNFSPMQLLAILYAIMVIPALVSSPQILTALARPTLEGIQTLMSSPAGAAAGWIHYLCFDLFVGVSVWRKAIDKNQSFLWVSIVLMMVLMFGPLGWLIHELASIRRKANPT